jgi:nucleotide-binding universal stress UspA family protein
MTWKPIVAGVDGSPEGTRAAVVAARLAETAGTTCYLAHAVRDPFTDATLAQVPLDLSDVNRIVRDAAAIRIRNELRDKVPAALLDRLDVRLGPAGWVLNDVVDERKAELLVLGGKHHSALGRWIGGSTALHMARTIDVPMLVTGDTQGGFRRILVAVDLSSGARLAIDAAERFAGLFDASLRVLHVVEPLPLLPELPTVLTDEGVMEQSERELERAIWPLIHREGVDHMVRRGHAAEVIAAASEEWSADLVVMASHGRGWVDRVLIGSVTEKLLNRLPTSVLVVPMTKAPARSTPAGKRPVAAVSAH